MPLQNRQLRHVDIREIFGGWSVQLRPDAQEVVILDSLEMKFFNRDDKELIDQLPEPWKTVVTGAFAYPDDEIRGLWLGHWQIDLIGEPQESTRRNIAALADEAVEGLLYPSRTHVEVTNMPTSSISDPKVVGKFAPGAQAIRDLKAGKLSDLTLGAPRYSLLNLGGIPVPGSHRELACAGVSGPTWDHSSGV